MGLLDFLATKPATPAPTQNPGGLVVSPTPAQQGYTAQTNPAAQIQKSYKDLQYPMPGANSGQLGTTSLPEANGLQPQKNYATEALPSLSTPVTDPATHVETVLDNGVRQVTHNTDSLNTPVPEVPAQPIINNSQPLYSYTENPVPADLMVQSEPLDTLDQAVDVPAQPEVTPTVPAELSNPVPTIVENVVPGVTVSAPSELPPEPLKPVEEEAQGSIIEIGSPTDQPKETEVPITTEPVKEEIPVPTLPPVPTTPLPPAVPELPKLDVEEKTDAPEDLMSTPVPNIMEEKPEDNTLQADPVMTAEEIVEDINKPINQENKQEVAKSSLNILNKIAFISLNTQSVNSSLSKKVKSLSEQLKSLDTEIYIDSNKGYGMDVISGLSGTSNKVTAAYLKPFYSKYVDEATLEVPLENLTKITFSTVLDRIKFLYKEATVFIVPETSGLNSLSQVVFLLNSQAMYYGTHKPVILFGSAWKDKLNSLKNSFGITQQEMDSMYFASTPEEVMSLLTKLDAEFSAKKVTKNSVVDMRDEQGEKEGLLSA